MRRHSSDAERREPNTYCPQRVDTSRLSQGYRGDDRSRRGDHSIHSQEGATIHDAGQGRSQIYDTSEQHLGASERSHGPPPSNIVHSRRNAAQLRDSRERKEGARGLRRRGQSPGDGSADFRHQRVSGVRDEWITGPDLTSCIAGKRPCRSRSDPHIREIALGGRRRTCPSREFLVVLHSCETQLNLSVPT